MADSQNIYARRADQFDHSVIPPKALIEAMEMDRRLHERETAVRTAELKLVKRTLDQCALTEGVNALENCDGLVRQYLRMVKTHQYYSPPPSELAQQPGPSLRTTAESLGLSPAETLYLGKEGVDAVRANRAAESAK